MLVFACLCGCIPRVYSAGGGQELLLKKSSGTGVTEGCELPNGCWEGTWLL